MKIRVALKKKDSVEKDVKKHEEYSLPSRISNPNIPIASDFEDIFTSDLNDKADRYIQMAKNEEKIDAAREEQIGIKETAERIEEELKEVDPDFAIVAAKNKKELSRAVKVKKKNSIPWRNYLIFLVIITALSACVTFSKYISKFEGDSQAVVAKFDVQIIAPQNLSVNASGNPEVVFDGYLNNKEYLGENADKVYTYVVKNNSEVAVFINCNVSGNVNHTISVSPTNVKLLPDEETEISFTFTPSNTAIADENVIVSFSSTQVN